MLVSIELSHYPLDKNYAIPIRRLIDRFQQSDQVQIKVQPMSTLIIGEFDTCMDLIKIELSDIFSSGNTSATILKIVNADLSDQ